MPKYIPYGAKTTQDTRRKYRVTGGKDWIDPFPIGFGTRPEKMVYEALSRRGIRFEYCNDITFSDSYLEFFKTYQADFILPDQKIIIEIQGFKWHSTPSAIEADSIKFATYEQFGWKALAWWDYEIEDNVNLLFAKEPLLSGYNADWSHGSTEFIVKRTKTDTSKGIRTLNKRRKGRLAYRKSPVKVKGKKPIIVRKTKVYGR